MGLTIREKPLNSSRYRIFENRGGKVYEIKGTTFYSQCAARDARRHIKFLKEELWARYRRERWPSMFVGLGKRKKLMSDKAFEDHDEADSVDNWDRL